MQHFILTYGLAPDYLVRRAEVRAEHLALAWEAAGRGELLLAGAVGDPPESALLLFSSRDGAEQFAQGDPYVTQGLVTSWRVRPWITVAGDGAATPVRP